MRIEKQKKSYKKLILGLVVILLVACIGYVVYAKQKALWPFEGATVSSQSDHNPTSKEQGGNDTSSETNNSTKTSTEGNQLRSTPNPTPKENADGGKPTVGMEITYTNKVGSTYQIRTLIQTITSDGTCTLTLSGADGLHYTDTSGVQALPSSTTCKGFDVPLSKLTSEDLTIKVHFENNDVTSNVTKKVSL